MSTLRRCEIKRHPPTTEERCPVCVRNERPMGCTPSQALYTFSGIIIAFEMMTLVAIFWLAHR